MSTNLREKLSETVQSFLGKFKISQSVENTTFQFKANPTVFVFESQVPEIWLTSKNPIDKNQVYYGFNDKYLPKNPFPNVSYIIPVDSAFKSKEVNIGKIELDDLFGSKEVSPSPQVTAVFGGTSVETLKEKEKEKEKEEKKDDHISTVKKWFLSFPKGINYGPYTGEEIYTFLNNLYKNKALKVPEFMIADSESDFHFKPESLFEILSEDIQLKGKKIDEFDEENRNLDKAVRKRSDSPTVFSERKYCDSSKMITKYDVAEMNSKFKNAQYLPISNLKNQLNFVKSKSTKNAISDSFMFPLTPASTKNINSRKTPRNKFEMGSNYNMNLINTYGKENVVPTQNLLKSNSTMVNATPGINDDKLKIEFGKGSEIKYTNISTEQLFA